MKDELTIDDLYFDAVAFDQQAVLQTLKDKVSFTEEHDILFAIDLTSIKVRESILVYGLAKKVLKANGKIEDETFTSREVTEKTELNNDSVRGRMSELTKEKLLAHSSSKYQIPSFKVAEVLDSLTENGD